MSTAPTLQLLLPSLLAPPSPIKCHYHLPRLVSFSIPPKRRKRMRLCCTRGSMKDNQAIQSDIDCVGTGSDVECFVTPSVEVGSESDKLLSGETGGSLEIDSTNNGEIETDLIQKALDWGLLISPFFFWGTAMVAMKEVIPKTGPFFVSAFRLIPAGLLLIGFAALKGRKQPSGSLAWLSIILFGVVDAACFQVRWVN